MGYEGKESSEIDFSEVDFGDGIRQAEDMLSVGWPGGVWLKLYYLGVYHLIIERDGSIFKHQVVKKKDAQMLMSVKRWAKDICDGKYKSKKTEREQIYDMIMQRNLTSYMNSTKWREFRTAMLEEMPFCPPYDYKTLFDDSNYIFHDYIQHLMKNEGPDSFSSFDGESFNFLDYKSLEWVKVRPRFFAFEGGQFMKKQVWYDAEKEFIAILKKFSIPYELENGVYTIYGYK